MDLRGNAVTWLGHGTWLWQSSEGRRILVDCWLEENPATPDAYKDPAALDNLKTSVDYWREAMQRFYG